MVEDYNFNVEDYKPEVIDAVRYKYAQTILSTKDLDNLQWAKEFMDRYEQGRRTREFERNDEGKIKYENKR